MKKILYIIAAFITISFSSCESETDILTIVNQGQGFSFTGTTSSIQQLLGQNTYNTLTGVLGIPIYTGDNPPSLNGNYNIFEMLRTANAIDPSDPFLGMIDGRYIKIELSSQDNGTLTIAYRGSFWDPGLDGIPGGSDDTEQLNEAAVGDIFVSGNTGTGAFTIFVEVKVNNDPNDLDTIALSGIRTSNGIADLTYAYVSFDSTGTIDEGLTWTDDDGVSPNF